MTRDVQHHVLFEIATEVCNRVGGIYSVIKSKAPVTCAEYGSRYCLIGPLNPQTASVEVEEEEPADAALKCAVEAMESRGIRCRFGRWLIEGAPSVLLFDTKSAYSHLDEWKADLWTTAGIPTPPADSETNEAIVFGYLVAWFLGEYVYHNRAQAVVAHFHEWLAGVCLPLCRKRRIDVTTVFTTHATILGRYLCAGSVDFYNHLEKFDVDAEAGKRGIYHRYCIERAAAHSADVFTTVSPITAYEAEHLLKRKPDGVLPNGLNVVKFSAVHEFQNIHAVRKAQINRFIAGHFYGHYDFLPEDTLYFFTAGRYEYRNKGVDFFIESLARLNHKLKVAGSKKTVVAFIVMPAATHSYTVETLKGQAVVRALETAVTEIQQSIGRRLMEACARAPTTEEASSSDSHVSLPAELTPSEAVLLKRRVFALKRSALPPIVTHNMADDATDPILSQIRRVQLFNHPSDRVKVVFHPEFLNANNPVLPLDYDDFVRGCHLGVFPSYYEPWGYTPAECTVMGVPSITTNLSGFGCYMEDLVPHANEHGIYVVDRRGQSIDESIDQLTRYMFEFTLKTQRQRINQRNRTERLRDLLDWKRMGREYVKARELALRRAYPGGDFADSSAAKAAAKVAAKAEAKAEAKAGGQRGSEHGATPGDFASLGEGREALETEDYVGFRLGAGSPAEETLAYPLSLHGKRGSIGGIGDS